jgi:hypothetical protein
MPMRGQQRSRESYPFLLIDSFECVPTAASVSFEKRVHGIARRRARGISFPVSFAVSAVLNALNGLLDFVKEILFGGEFGNGEFVINPLKRLWDMPRRVSDRP